MQKLTGKKINKNKSSVILIRLFGNQIIINVVRKTNKESLIKAIEPFPVSTGKAFYLFDNE